VAAELEVADADLDPLDVAAWHSRSVTLAEKLRRERMQLRDLETSVAMTGYTDAGKGRFAQRFIQGMVLGIVSTPLVIRLLVWSFGE
jgi:hypothetical protein